MWKLSQRVVLNSKLLRKCFLNPSDANPQIIGKSYFARGKKTDESADEVFSISKLFQPGNAMEGPGSKEAIELTGEVTKPQILDALNSLYTKPAIRELCEEYGMDEHLQRQAFASFRKYCFDKEKITPELYIKLYDVINKATHADDLFPYFLKHSQQIFPHLTCMGDLKKISDLSDPSTSYPMTRKKQRKIIFHAGPTNSGKTYHAMQRFLNAKSGIYCGPLKLLAMEVFQKSNAQGTVCDLVTGEEKRSGNPDGSQANHVAITVEMAPVEVAYEVAIIDEIQMIKDQSRGWAWTRAFLGINADELHICGEAGTKDLIEQLCLTTGEILEYNHYDRLTPLTIEDKALESFSNLKDGDCIVCFNKNDIYEVTREIEKLGKEVAVIYGSLPPNTKLAQAAKFNDPDNPCKVMVATDAIGMGLNLSIRRIIFYSVVKMQLNEKGEKEIQSLSVSMALQIAGRAGRFRTKWEHGYVTTFKPTDLVTLKFLLSQSPEEITQAGIHPTPEQIEMYAYHLPNSTMSNLIDIFKSLSTMNHDLYFMCMIEDFKFLADTIQHIPLKLRSRYLLCCAPVNRNQPFVCAMFTKFANLISKDEPVTFDYVATNCGLPVALPKTIGDLVQLENIFDVMDIYLWLSYRFLSQFPHSNEIREAQSQLDQLIQKGLLNITKLIKDAEKNSEVKALSKKHRAVRESNESVKASITSTADRLKNERLSDYLIRKGVLSKDMLSQIQLELGVDTNSNPLKTFKMPDNKTSRKKSKKTKKTKKGK